MGQLPLPKTNEDAEFENLIQWARRNFCSCDDIARLAKHLADSGERLAWPGSWKVADLASTGGPGSLSTLLTPLALMIRKCRVVKLGVPGRPAGAIDTLCTIPGYRAGLSAEEVQSIADKSGFVHFLANDRFAPLDAALYSFRRRIGAVDIPMLAASSLLAKKLAVGVRMVGLDVRIGNHGNFGQTIEEARQNAANFCTAAKMLDINAIAFIGKAMGPSQPWIGRGESLVALAYAVGILKLDNSGAWLREHIRNCLEMARIIANDGEGICNEESEFLAQQSSVALRDALEKHLNSQGASIVSFIDRIHDVANAPRLELISENSGRLVIDLSIVRKVLVSIQNDKVDGPFSDPAGVVLLEKPRSLVEAGQPIAKIRCSGTHLDRINLLHRLNPAFQVVSLTSHGLQTEDNQLDVGKFNCITSMEVLHA